MFWVMLPIFMGLAAAVGVLSARLRAARLKLRSEHAAGQAQSARLREVEKVAARNAAILQHAMDGFFVLGEDSRFREVNEAFCRMTGYSAQELLNMRMSDLEVSTPICGSDQAAYWQTGLHHFTTSHRHKDGHIIQLESCVMALRDGESKILVGLARDVTERYRAAEALARSEARYRNLVETSGDLIWSLDLEGRWTFVNSASRTLYGYEPNEMLGRHVTEFVRPEMRERTLGILAELRSGKPRLSFEAEHLRKDGSTAYLSINAIPLLDGYGNVTGFTGTSTDLTYRREAERQLRQAHDRFASLVARMPLGYVVWSEDFRILEWNPAATTIFGYSAEEAIGRSVGELIIPAEAESAFSQMRRSLLAGTPHSGTVLTNRKRSGEKIECEWHNTVLPDPGGGPARVVSLVRDVSERQRLEAQLHQSQKLESLGVLAGGLAHDFNNLLVGIMGNASLAMERLPANSALRPLLEKVVNAGRRATDLTQRMLAYAGRANCDVQTMDLNRLVEEMVDFAAAAVPKNVTLKVRIRPDLPPIRADSGQMQQVIMNLLINAAEAIGPGGGEVTVSTRLEELDAGRIAAEFADQRLTPGPYVCLEVRDTGCGIDPEILGRIFDPFFTTKFAGRGLGLSAILGIVRAHHGAITVNSQVGVGTVFCVFVPAASASLAPGPSQKRPCELPRGFRVLVIDDEEDVREVVREVLEARGIEVLLAADGTAGLEIFQQHRDRIDAVLLDMNMPGLSGEVVFRRLRAIKPDVRVILSTGYSEQEAELHFGGVPLAGFVHKPYTASMLVDKIGAAIGAR